METIKNYRADFCTISFLRTKSYLSVTFKCQNNLVVDYRFEQEFLQNTQLILCLVPNLKIIKLIKVDNGVKPMGLITIAIFPAKSRHRTLTKSSSYSLSLVTSALGRTWRKNGPFSKTTICMKNVKIRRNGRNHTPKINL